MEKKEKIKLEDYTYVSGQKVELDGALFIAMLNLCSKIKIEETKEVLLLNTPKKITKDGVEWRGTTPQEFFSSSTQEGLTAIGASALDMEFMLARVHEDNINMGRATHKDQLLKLQKEDATAE